MTPSHLQQWILHPETLNRETLYELRTLIARYPYFQSLRLLYLKNLYLLHDINFGAELRKSALYVSDRRVLFYLIEGDRYILQPYTSTQVVNGDGEEALTIDRTLSLIDAFLVSVPKEHFQTTDLDYTMDYTAYLMQDYEGTENQEESLPVSTEVQKLRGQDLIDGFIRQSEREATREKEVIQEVEMESTHEIISPELPSDDLDDSCFTETLAKIYVKQHRYDKALEIIKKLSLNYPKKNAYFADQIRFLEKLIINAKSK